MKNTSKSLYNESLDSLINLILFRPEFKHLSNLLSSILKISYEEGFNEEIEIDIIQDNIVLNYEKYDRKLNIFINKEKNIEYIMIDNSKNLENLDIKREVGKVLYNLEHAINRLINWLIRGLGIAHYKVNTNNIIIRYSKKEEEQNEYSNR